MLKTLKEKILWIILLLSLLNIGLFIELSKIERLSGDEIIILNVDQGDAIIVKSQGFVGLIDTGPRSIISERIKDYLPMSTTKLDFLLLTHPDKDHIEGFIRIAESYQIDKLFMNTSTKKGFLIDEVNSIISRKNIAQSNLNEQIDFYFGNFKINTVWPLSTQVYTEDSNDSSIALEISKGNCNVYTAGDLSAEFEVKSTQYLFSKDIEVLKAGHHGSRTSTSEEFIQLINPQLVLFSFGKDNSYGHPHQEVMTILEKRNIDTLNTINGNIELKFLNENSIKISDKKREGEIRCF